MGTITANDQAADPPTYPKFGYGIVRDNERAKNVRLELTWPNKDGFLLVPRDTAGKPVWVDREHPSASEVRLADFVDSTGQVNDSNPHADNLLFNGDSLDVLRILCEVPEFRREYRGRIKLVYLDPPFNTGQTFAHYDDWMEHSTWLSQSSGSTRTARRPTCGFLMISIVRILLKHGRVGGCRQP